MDTPHPSLQRLMDEAPFVRLLARTLLAEDADEVVQQTWLRAIQHGGDAVETPRAWLGQIVRNVARNLRRDRRRQHQHEAAVAATDLVPSSAELMQHEEQRRLLVAAVDRLPEQLRAVVLLRYFDGLLPQAIAMRLGVPSTTVRNQLRRALQLLRERLDAEHGGDRRAWLLPLVPFAANGKGASAGTAAVTTGVGVTVGLGVITMTMKTKLVAALGVLLAVTGALVLWAMQDPVPGNPGHGAQQPAGAGAETANLPRDPMPANAENTVAREAVSSVASAPATTGALVVHVRYGDDKRPAANVTVTVGRLAADNRVDGLRQRTDANGTARFPSVPPGRAAITCDRGVEPHHRVDVVAGETTTLDYELPIGLHLTGIVVGAAEAPVAGAWIEVLPTPAGYADAEVLAVSGPDGRFVVRSAPSSLLVGARAEGHSPSPLEYVTGKDGNAAEVRLVLGQAAGGVDGIVVDEQARPVAGAVVRIGVVPRLATAPIGNRAPPLTALVRSDAEGRFRAIGVPPGAQPVVARASEFAPWQGTIEVGAHLTARLRIDLRVGGAIRGRVVDAAGAPVAKAQVEVGQWGELAHYVTTSTEDGSFALSGLPLGDVVLMAKHGQHGRAQQSVPTGSGTTTACELRLSRGHELRGRIVDEAGAPIVGAHLSGLVPMDGAIWSSEARSDGDGRFALPNCPEGKLMAIQVMAVGFDMLARNGIDPTVPLELVLRRSQAMTVRIRGVVVSPEGQPLPNAMVMANGVAPPSKNRMLPTGADGRFELGPMVPGRWTLTVRAKGYPNYRGEPVELVADAVHDVGEIRMPDGGQAIVTVEGDRQGVRFRVYDEAGRGVAELVEENGVLVSEKLASGPHFLRVHGKTMAAMSIPFVARAREKTSVAVKLVAGTRQRFEIVASVLEPRPAAVNLEVRLGQRSLTSYRVMWPADQPATAELCLPPGEFTLVVEEGARQFATAAFTVGSTEAAPLRVELR